MPPPDWMTSGSREIAEAAEAMLKRHEQEAHGGETCILERAGLVAYLAHRLGVRDHRSLTLMLEALADYERSHHERHIHEHTGGGEPHEAGN